MLVGASELHAAGAELILIFDFEDRHHLRARSEAHQDISAALLESRPVRRGALLYSVSHVREHRLAEASEDLRVFLDLDDPRVGRLFFSADTATAELFLWEEGIPL